MLNRAALVRLVLLPWKGSRVKKSVLPAGSKTPSLAWLNGSTFCSPVFRSIVANCQSGNVENCRVL